MNADHVGKAKRTAVSIAMSGEERLLQSFYAKHEEA